MNVPRAPCFALAQHCINAELCEEAIVREADRSKCDKVRHIIT